jgi:hypothetical protein
MISQDAKNIMIFISALDKDLLIPRLEIPQLNLGDEYATR